VTYGIVLIRRASGFLLRILKPDPFPLILFTANSLLESRFPFAEFEATG
jgi:hypothetical protein